MNIPILDVNEVRELQAYRLGVYEGMKKGLMEAIDVCAQKKTPWACIQEIAARYDEKAIKV